MTKCPYWPQKSRHHLTQWSPEFDQSFMHHLQMPKASVSLTLIPLHNYSAAHSSGLQWSRAQHMFAHFPQLQCLPLLIMISCKACEFWVLQGFSWQLTKPEANTDSCSSKQSYLGFFLLPLHQALHLTVIVYDKGIVIRNMHYYKCPVFHMPSMCHQHSQNTSKDSFKFLLFSYSRWGIPPPLCTCTFLQLNSTSLWQVIQIHR